MSDQRHSDDKDQQQSKRQGEGSSAEQDAQSSHGEESGYYAVPGAIRESEGEEPPTGPTVEGPFYPTPPPPEQNAPSAAPPTPPMPPPLPPSRNLGAQAPRPPQQQQQQQQRPPYGAPPPQQQRPGNYGAPPPQQQWGSPPPAPYGGQWGPPPPGGQGGYRPPGMPGSYGAPPPRRNRALPIIIAVFIIAFIVITAIVGIVGGTIGSGSGLALGGARIAILDIEGVLGEGSGYGADTKVLVDQVKEWTENKNVKAIVLRINSPGGAVSATQDLYSALNKFREDGRPVIASMGDISASGGYYAAMAADEVYANAGSLTGSIGVIMSFYNTEGLQEKIGIYSRNVKSGEFKDMGSGSRAMTVREKELLDEMVTDVFDQFFDAVAQNREETVRAFLSEGTGRPVAQIGDDEVRDHLAQYTDGRIFTGRQAYNYRMIDSLGTLDDAVERARQLTGLPEDARTVRAPVQPTGLFGSIGTVANHLEHQVSSPGVGAVRLEYRLGGL